MSHFPQSTSDGAPVPMRVTHVVKGLGPGGAERLIVNQLETSSAAIDSTVMRLISHKDHLVAEVEQAGATSVLVGNSPLWPLALRKKLLAAKPDVIHAHSPVLAVAVRLLVRFGGVSAAVVTTEHNRWPRHHWLTRRLNRLTSHLDDGRLAVSEDVRNSMHRSLHTTTQVLDHGVPIAALQGLRTMRGEMRARLLGDDSDRTVIGIVANFRPEKAYDVFLDAAITAVEREPSLRFFVVGQGPGEDEFRAAVAASGVADAVEVLGYRDDATEVMSAFDIFTLTSNHEGKPVSLMEAFAIGVPVVATRAGGIPEAVTDGVNGLLVDVGDADAVANAWIELATNAERRAEMAHAAAETAPNFDASVATRSIESLYSAVRA